jgi:hypothetical protein
MLNSFIRGAENNSKADRAIDQALDPARFIADNFQKLCLALNTLPFQQLSRTDDAAERVFHFMAQNPTETGDTC